MPAGRPKGTFKWSHPCRVDGKLTKTYRTWQGMIARCTRESHPAFKYYGGKGVKVCDRWTGPGGYQNFINDVGVAPEGLWIERKDSKGHYTPENCCWETPAVQARNREQGGKHSAQPMSLKSLCKVLGVKYSLVYQRVVLRNWTYQEAFTIPRL